MNESVPIQRRYIFLTIALVSIDITLIYHEFNIRFEDYFNGFFGYIDLIFKLAILSIIIIIHSNLVTQIIMKRYGIKSQKNQCIISGLIGFPTKMVYIFLKFYVFLDWTQRFRFQIHCTELIVFQFSVILDTILVNWKPEFFVV